MNHSKTKQRSPVKAYLAFVLGVSFIMVLLLVPIMFLSGILSRCLSIALWPTFRVFSGITSLFIGYFVFRGVVDNDCGRKEG